MKFTEAQLDSYSQPLSATEDQMCKNSIGMIRDALKTLGFSDHNRSITKLFPDTYAYSLELSNIAGRKIKLFVQGSYANNTNVRTESDVDIAVIQEETFTTHYRSSTSYPQSDADYNFIRLTPAAKSFKDEVQECLVSKFGNDVERKNKSIKVHGNTYRKDADTVPCRRYRDYSNDFRKDVSNFVGGIVISCDDGKQVINYPEQHIENGRKKNNATNYHYKKYVRIIKKMKYLMADEMISSVSLVSSFGLESLLWNIPDNWYVENCVYRKVFNFQLIINYLCSHYDDIPTYKEANGIKQLCPNSTVVAAYKNFIVALKNFYRYE